MVGVELTDGKEKDDSKEEKDEKEEEEKDIGDNEEVKEKVDKDAARRGEADKDDDVSDDEDDGADDSEDEVPNAQASLSDSDDDSEDEDALPTMQVTEVYKALSGKKIGKLAIFSWEAEEVDSEGEWRKLAGKNKKDKKKGKSGCPKGKAGKACRKAEKKGKTYYYGDMIDDFEPETYAGNFRLEIRYGKNEEYEMLTEQVVAESTDGKYYFVMPEAACGQKVQVRVTGLGPDGDETEAVESKAKKLKC